MADEPATEAAEAVNQGAPGDAPPASAPEAAGAGLWPMLGQRRQAHAARDALREGQAPRGFGETLAPLAR